MTCSWDQENSGFPTFALMDDETERHDEQLIRLKFTQTRPGRFGRIAVSARSLGTKMKQSELVDKVAQKTTLTQAAAAGAVRAVVQAILESLVAGEPVRVSGLGTFNVAARPARDGRNPQTGESIKIPASKAVRFHAGKTVKDALNPPRSVGNKKSARPKRSGARK
jgi:DNA-binding protein HU-beta